MEYFSDLKAKLIYVFRINDETHRNCLKIGETTYDGDINAQPNSNALNKAAQERIKGYTSEAGLHYELLHTETAFFIRDGKIGGINDKEVHTVLLRSGIKRKNFETGAREWFVCDLQTARNAIAAAKTGHKSLHPSQITEEQSPIIFRPEQRKAIDKTLKYFEKGSQMLWYAKMRFGKTLSALQVVKEYGRFRRVLILTHRPVVAGGWFDDFGKIFYDTPDFVFGSKEEHGERFQQLEEQARKGNCRYVYFASMQDLRGSEQVGGNFDKNNEIFSATWDLLIMDEAHEGTQTKLGEEVRKALVKTNTKVLLLSGTPFNLFEKVKNEEEIFTWDYVMEQRAKSEWDKTHPWDDNPYALLPQLNIYTYDLGRLMSEFADEDIAFNFREFFRTDDKDEFVHRPYVESFLRLLTKPDEKSMYPFANERYRNIFRHTLWVLPGVKAAKALSAMLQQHSVFQHFSIVNVAGDGDEDESNVNALEKVKNAIGDEPDQTYTITLSCGRLTTGVSVPEWTGVFMLSGSFNTAASGYMQTIFRVQTPFTLNGRVKENCYVFDFAPDRTLKVLAETAKISTKAGKQSNDERKQLGEFLNFCPIISIEGSQMKKFDTDQMLQQLKRVYVERVVQNGFEDGYLYNDELLRLSDVDIKEFDNLKRIIGQTKAMAKTNDIIVNEQGLTNEEYEEKEKLEKKKKNELSEEEKARLEELKKKRKVRDDAVSILRGISIRMPLLIYGADISDEDSQLSIGNFTSLVDDYSWEEFMPKGVSKEKFETFQKYYDPDIFTAAAKRIRQMTRAADRLSIEERIERIASIFATFRNPDKETVLTPWRVVNMHMSDCLGGYTFFNEDFSKTLEDPRFVDRGTITADVFSLDSPLLEINSKSGLYPLYLAYNIYRTRLRNETTSPDTLEKHQALWDATIAENIFVICKTPMAKSITRRTLLGFRDKKTNMWAPEDLINKIKNQPELFIKKVQALVGKNMNIKAIVGNPPYQIMDGGTQASASPIYNKFVEVAKLIKPTYISMIMPSRWFAGGKGLEDFRSSMINDKHIVILHDYLNGIDIFPNVEIKGGICYFLRDEKSERKCKVVSHEKGKIISENNRYLKESDSEVFIRHELGVSIFNKITALTTKYFESLVSTQKPFGLRTFVHGKTEPFYGSIQLFENGGVGYILPSEVEKNTNWINLPKIYVSRAYNAGDNYPHQIIGRPIISLTPSCCTETYIVIGPFENEKITINTEKYLRTKLARFLIMLKKSSQQTSSVVYGFVPLQDFTEKSDIDWSKSVEEIDQQLYVKYNLTEEEIAFIESMIKPM